MKKPTFIVSVFVALLAGAIGEYLLFHQTAVTASAPVGTTNSSAKLASVIMAPATLSASSTSIYNTDAYDRIITDSFVDCNTVGNSFTSVTGAGLASWTLQMATTSTNGLGLQGNTNYVSNLTVATTTVNAYTASSTNPAPNPVGRVWPSGTYLSVGFNATNTASCVVGVHYLSF